MEAYSSSSSSSTSSMYLAANNNNVTSSSSSEDQLRISNAAARKPFHSSLHSIRSNNNNKGKPWNNKKLHIAPLPPNPPRVYKVDPFNFRDLVQRLTGSAAAEASQQPHQYQQVLQQGRMQSSAPPKLDLLELQSQLPQQQQQLLPPTQSKSGSEEGEGEGLVERQEGSPFSGLFRVPETTARKSNDMSVMMRSSSYVEEDSNINDYFYNNNTPSDGSLELNLLPSPTSQHCWFPQLLSPEGPGNLISGLDHPQRTINL